MESVAKHYASELDAQFRTLNHFVNHAGEIGRAHETFLRGILARFLPDDLKLGSGFVASPEWISRQQDILIYKRDFTKLFQVGECVVVDHDAFVGTIEVKTQIKSLKSFKETVEILAELKEKIRHRGVHALYAWDAVSVDKALEALWAFVRKDPTKRFDSMPDVVYVRGKYLLMANRDGNRESPPFFSWQIGEPGITEGQFLLGLVSSIWRFGLSQHLPWWLLNRHKHLGMFPSNPEPVPWPHDLQEAVMADLKTEKK